LPRSRKKSILQRLHFKEAVEGLVRIRRRDVERMETETVRLALAIARKIIGYETEQGEVIGHVVKTAMQKVADPRHLTLRLNPKDIDTVKLFPTGSAPGRGRQH
jgi:flagellar biosynthesis/type III secretory pathway protein FliH